MRTSEKEIYQAKVGNLYVRSISLYIGEEITLSSDNKFARYLNQQEKDFLLKHFPEATVKKLKIIEEGNHDTFETD